MPINGGYSSFGSDAATPKMEFSSGPAIAQAIPADQQIHTAGTGLGTMLPHMKHSLDFAADSIAVMDAVDCCVDWDEKTPLLDPKENKYEELRPQRVYKKNVKEEAHQAEEEKDAKRGLNRASSDGWADEGKKNPVSGSNRGPEVPRSMEPGNEKGGGVYKAPKNPEPHQPFDIKNFMRKGAGDDLALDPVAEDKKRFTESLHHRDSNGHYVKSNTDPKKDKKVYPSQADAASDKMTDPIHEHTPHYPKPVTGEHLPEDSAEDRVPASEVRKHILGPNEKGEYTVGAHHKGDFAASSHIPSEHKAKRLATVLAGKIAKQSVRDEAVDAVTTGPDEHGKYKAHETTEMFNKKADPTVGSYWRSHPDNKGSHVGAGNSKAVEEFNRRKHVRKDAAEDVLHGHDPRIEEYKRSPSARADSITNRISPTGKGKRESSTHETRVEERLKKPEYDRF